MALVEQGEVDGLVEALERLRRRVADLEAQQSAGWLRGSKEIGAYVGLSGAAELSGSQWRTASELAEHLRVDVKTVHRLSGPKLNGAGIPFHRIGPNGEKRFCLREVDEWVRSRDKRLC